MLKVSQEQELEKAVREVSEIDNEMSQFLQRLVNEVHNMPNETPPQEKMVQGIVEAIIAGVSAMKTEAKTI